MKKYLPKLGKLQEESNLEDCIENQHLIYKISQAIVRNRKWIKLKNRCYPEAIAAKRMLHRRGICSTLYIGVRRVETGVTAHAWLRCGSVFVVGKRDMSKFAVVNMCS